MSVVACIRASRHAIYARRRNAPRYDEIICAAYQQPIFLTIRVRHCHPPRIGCRLAAVSLFRTSLERASDWKTRPLFPGENNEYEERNAFKLKFSAYFQHHRHRNHSENTTRWQMKNTPPTQKNGLVGCATDSYASLRNAGNRITSRMLGLSVSNIMSRSMPTPQPPAGGMPYSSARIKSAS